MSKFTRNHHAEGLLPKGEYKEWYTAQFGSLFRIDIYQAGNEEWNIKIQTVLGTGVLAPEKSFDEAKTVALEKAKQILNTCLNQLKKEQNEN